VSAAVAVALLVAGGTYLVLQRGLVRVTLGFILLGHAANLVLVAAGGMSRREPPLVGEVDPAVAADPLPQAFALTAIVITFGITVFLFGLAGAGADDEGGDQEGTDVEGALGPDSDAAGPPPYADGALPDGGLRPAEDPDPGEGTAPDHHGHHLDDRPPERRPDRQPGRQPRGGRR